MLPGSCQLLRHFPKALVVIFVDESRILVSFDAVDSTGRRNTPRLWQCEMVRRQQAPRWAIRPKTKSSEWRAHQRESQRFLGLSLGRRLTRAWSTLQSYFERTWAL